MVTEMKESIMKTLVSTLGAAAMAVTLASCSTPVSGPAAAPSGTQEYTAPSGETSAPAVDEPEAEEDDGTAQFGQTYAWDDGLEVVVKDDGKFRPSSSAYAPGRGPYRKYRITITNGTGEPFDASMVQVSLASGGEDQEAVIDTARDIGVRPETTLRDGKSVSYTEAFGVPDNDDVTLEIAPDYSHESALYIKEG